MIVRFLPHNQEIEVEPGENLLRAATEAGVYVQASCGGEGVCGKCRVTIEKGEVDGPCPASLPEEDFRRGVRLACQTRILDDLEVRIPVEAFLDAKTLLRGRGRVSAGRKLSHQKLESAVLGECFTPTSAKRFLEIGPPSLQENQVGLGPGPARPEAPGRDRGNIRGSPHPENSAESPAAGRLESDGHVAAQPVGIFPRGVPGKGLAAG